jgi:hypothetical protein
MSLMRTTLTIDDDLADLLKRQARERDLSFRDVVNRTLRAGTQRRKPSPTYSGSGRGSISTSSINSPTISCAQRGGGGRGTQRHSQRSVPEKSA